AGRCPARRRGRAGLSRGRRPPERYGSPLVVFTTAGPGGATDPAISVYGRRPRRGARGDRPGLRRAPPPRRGGRSPTSSGSRTPSRRTVRRPGPTAWRLASAPRRSEALGATVPTELAGLPAGRVAATTASPEQGTINGGLRAGTPVALPL